MKVRVLYPTAFQQTHPDIEAGAIIDLEDADAQSRIEAGSAEAANTRVEKATAAPGEKRTARVPKQPNPED